MDVGLPYVLSTYQLKITINVLLKKSKMITLINTIRTVKTFEAEWQIRIKQNVK